MRRFKNAFTGLQLSIRYAIKKQATGVLRRSRTAMA
jgi:hypothetical protein